MAAIKTTIIVFALLGPPIGMPVFLLGVAAIDPKPASLIVLIENLIGFIIMGIPFCYVIGIIPALAVGMLTAIGENISRRFGFVHVALLGLVCGLVFALTIGRNGGLGYAVVKVLTCLVPTIACWEISRWWNLGQNEQSNEAV